MNRDWDKNRREMKVRLKGGIDFRWSSWSSERRDPKVSETDRELDIVNYVGIERKTLVLNFISRDRRERVRVRYRFDSVTNPAFIEAKRWLENLARKSRRDIESFLNLDEHLDSRYWLRDIGQEQVPGIMTVTFYLEPDEVAEL